MALKCIAGKLQHNQMEIRKFITGSLMLSNCFSAVLVRMNTQDIIKAVCAIFAAAFIFALFIFMLYQVKPYKTRTGRNDKISWLVYISIGYTLEMCVFFCLRAAIAFKYGVWNNLLHDTVGVIIIYAYTFCGVLMAVFVFLFGISQLYSTFNNTVYRISKTILTMHIITGSIWCICLIIASQIIWWTPSDSIANFGVLMFYTSLILLVLNIMHMAYLFNRNLFALVLTQRQSILVSSHNDKNQDIKASMNEQQLSILSVITRTTVLLSWMILLFGFLLLFALISNFHSSSWTGLLYQLGWVGFGCGSTIGMSLALININRVYYNCMCQYCDDKCVVCCSRLAQYFIDKRNANTNDGSFHVNNVTPNDDDHEGLDEPPQASRYQSTRL